MIRKLSVPVLLLLLVCSLASAETYTFKPTPVDLGDLSHDYYYSWAIQLTIPVGYYISDATLTLKNINNWTYEPNNNWLYIHLLDTAPNLPKRISSDVTRGTDNGGSGDYWNNKGPMVATYIDRGRYSETVTYSFTDLGLLPALETFAADGSIGLGFDPDCHYDVERIVLKVCVEQDEMVPEPSGLLVILSGITGIAGLVTRRRR